MRRLRGYLPQRHLAHCPKSEEGVQRRARLLLGVLFVRKGLSAARHRRAGIHGLCSHESQGNCLEGGREKPGFLEDKVQERPNKGVQVPDQNNSVELDQASTGIRVSKAIRAWVRAAGTRTSIS